MRNLTDLEMEIAAHKRRLRRDKIVMVVVTIVATVGLIVSAGLIGNAVTIHGLKPMIESIWYGPNGGPR